MVETCLLKQIASRSQHFFEALTTLQVRSCPGGVAAASQYEMECLPHTCLTNPFNSSDQPNHQTSQDVRDRVAQACQQVHRLRTGLHDIDRKTVMGMIRIPRLAQRKARGHIA